MSQLGTILLVEDEQGLADLYELWLSDRYSVDVVYSGKDALESIDESVDVVLLDRRMPGLSGDEVLTTLRNRGYECPVAMVSAVTPDVDIAKMPFDAYLRKPIEQDQLRDAVEQLLLIADCSDEQRAAFAIAQKIAVLEAETTPDDRDTKPEYTQLRTDLRDFDTELTEVLEQTDSEDLPEALLNKIDST